MTANPVTLSPHGEREVVTEDKAQEIISKWKSQLEAHRTEHPSLSPLCDTIDLSDKSYTIEAAKLIVKFLTSTEDGFSPSIASGIKIAGLNDIIASRMEEEGLQVLNTFSEAFESSTLVEVNLSDNAMGSKGVTQCQTVLAGKPALHSLQKLSLCNNGLSEASMNEIADLLTATSDDSGVEGGGKGATCIAQNLTKVHFFNNMSGNEGCRAFERIMHKCSDKLTDIRFSSTRARREGSSHITKALLNLATGGKLGNLTHLDLADNSFPECYSDLATALSYCVNLQYLNLKDCILGDDGVKEVCAAIMKANPPLSCIYLGANEITPKGAKSVAKLLQTLNGTIEVFDAEQNDLSSAGIKRIVQELNSISLKRVVLNENYFGENGAIAVMECLKKLPNLESIALDGNFFPSEIVDKLEETFGERLVEMEENDEDGEEEEEEEEEEEDSEEEEEEEPKEETKEADVDALAAALSKSAI